MLWHTLGWPEPYICLYAVYMTVYLQRGSAEVPNGVLLKYELSMGAPPGNNQAQYPEVAADSTCA
jgi:hypothetical protein